MATSILIDPPNDRISFGADSAVDIGTSSVRAQNVYTDNIGDTSQDLTVLATTVNLPSGHIFDYNGGDVTLTHGSNKVTLAGGTLVMGTTVYDAGSIHTNTADTNDNGLLQIAGGGAAGVTRGSYINLYGNEGGTAGTIQIFAGDASGTIQLRGGNVSIHNGDLDMITTGNRIDLDTDNDTSIRANADDVIILEAGGLDMLFVQGITSGAVGKPLLFDSPDFTLSDGATARFQRMSSAAMNVVLAGTTRITTLNQGIGLDIGGITVNQTGGAVTMDQASTLHVPVVTAGSSVTITANRMISTGVSDCYLTVGGVWTDTSSTEKVKRNIEDLDPANMASMIEQIRPRQYNYNGHFNDDFNRPRVGAVAEEFPDFLRLPGEPDGSGVSGTVLANFSVAGVKYLYDEIKTLKAEVAQLRKAE